MSPEDVRTLAAQAGVSFDPARLPVIADTWEAFIAPDLDRLMAVEVSAAPADTFGVCAPGPGFARPRSSGPRLG
jgi:hypothetical protein